MQSVMRCVRGETIKLFDRRKYKLMLAVPVVCCIVAGLMSFTTNTVVLGFTNLPMAMLSAGNNLIIPLLIFLMVADLLAGEQENGTIKAAITRPFSRSDVYLGKLISIMIYVAITYGAMLLASLIMSAVTGSFLSFNIGQCFLGYIISLIPAFVVLLMAGLISQITGSPSSTVIFCILAMAAFNLFGTLLPGIYDMMVTSYLGIYKLFMGSFISFKMLLTSAGMLVGYGLIFYAAGDYLTNRKDY